MSIRAGNIGETGEEWIVVPMTEPVTIPADEPIRREEPVPVEPEKVPV